MTALAQRLLSAIRTGILLACLAIPAGLVASENLVYSIHWGRIPVARAELVTFGDEIRLSIQTSGVANWLYPVSHQLVSRREVETGRPLFFTQQSSEGRRGRHQRDFRTSYLWDEGVTEGINHGGEPMEPLPLEEGMHDPLTMLYSFRGREMNPGDEIQLTICDGRHVRNYTVLVGEVETVSMPAGQIRAHRLTPATRDLGGVFRESANPTLLIWVSEEAPHIPVRFESQVRVGSFVAHLEETTPDHTWDPVETSPARGRRAR